MAIRTATGYGTFRPGFSGKERLDIGVALDTDPDVPARRRACLFQQDTKRLVDESWSNEQTGACAFEHIAEGRYFVVVLDHTLTYPAQVIADITVPFPEA